MGGVWGGGSAPVQHQSAAAPVSLDTYPPPHHRTHQPRQHAREDPGVHRGPGGGLQGVFQLFDTKGDGLIQVTQVGEVLRALGQNPTEGDVKKLVQSTNSKGGPDARVTFETFLPLLQAVSGKKITDTVDDFVEGLRHFDKEGNGRISAIELRHLLTGLGEKMSEEEVEQLIHGKEDSQGNINYEEFVKMVLAQLTKIMEEKEEEERGKGQQSLPMAATLLVS